MVKHNDVAMGRSSLQRHHLRIDIEAALVLPKISLSFELIVAEN